MKRTRRIDGAAAALWASAFVLAGMVVMQAGRLPENAAHAGMGVSDHDFTLVTAKSGRGQDADPDEVLYVLDSRTEALLVYWIEDARQQGVQMVDGGSLVALFQRGRGQ